MKNLFNKFLHVFIIISMVVWSVAPGFGALVKTVSAISDMPTGGSLSYFNGYKTHVPSSVAGEYEWITATAFSDPSGIASQIIKLYKTPLKNGVCGTFADSGIIYSGVINPGTSDYGFNDVYGGQEDG